ncbi:MAG: DUF835 domain-containing protein [Candidatus Thermoplasmatota archaeon]
MRSSPIEPGCSYILKEKSLRRCIKQFKELLSKGFKGLCITKHKPEKLKKEYKLGIEIFQLNNKSGKYFLSPKNPAEIVDKIEKFTQSTERGIVLFEGLDKLIKTNNFLDTLTMLEDINDRIMSSDSGLILAVDTSKFNKKELAFLERNLELFPTR